MRELEHLRLMASCVGPGRNLCVLGVRMDIPGNATRTPVVFRHLRINDVVRVMLARDVDASTREVTYRVTAFERVRGLPTLKDDKNTLGYHAGQYTLAAVVNRHLRFYRSTDEMRTWVEVRPARDLPAGEGAGNAVAAAEGAGA